MKRISRIGRLILLWYALLFPVTLPVTLWATGSLTIPNTIFTKPNPVPTSLLDQNWAAIATYVNAREVTFGLLAARPTAGTAGRYYFSTDTSAFYADNGTAWVQLSSAPLIGQRASLTLANTTGSTQFVSVFPGAVTSDDSAVADRIMLQLTSTISKKLTSWAVGTNLGCLDTGSAAAFTWYHVFAIQRVDTGVVDVLCSTSPTAPTMPSSYTKKQRLGSILTTWFSTAGNEIYPFVQVKNKFRWATVTTHLNVSNATPGAGTINTATLSVPNGVITEAEIACSADATGFVTVAPINVTDEFVPMCAAQTAAQGSQGRVMTDTAQRIRYRNEANVAVQIRTSGWYEVWE